MRQEGLWLALLTLSCCADGFAPVGQHGQWSAFQLGRVVSDRTTLGAAVFIDQLRNPARRVEGIDSILSQPAPSFISLSPSDSKTILLAIIANRDPSGERIKKALSLLEQGGHLTSDLLYVAVRTCVRRKAALEAYHLLVEADQRHDRSLGQSSPPSSSLVVDTESIDLVIKMLGRAGKVHQAWELLRRYQIKIWRTAPLGPFPVPISAEARAGAGAGAGTGITTPDNHVSATSDESGGALGIENGSGIALDLTSADDGEGDGDNDDADGEGKDEDDDEDEDFAEDGVVVDYGDVDFDADGVDASKDAQLSPSPDAPISINLKQGSRRSPPGTAAPDDHDDVAAAEKDSSSVKDSSSISIDDKMINQLFAPQFSSEAPETEDGAAAAAAAAGRLLAPASTPEIEEMGLEISTNNFVILRAEEDSFLAVMSDTGRQGDTKLMLKTLRLLARHKICSQRSHAATPEAAAAVAVESAVAAAAVDGDQDDHNNYRNVSEGFSAYQEISDSTRSFLFSSQATPLILAARRHDRLPRHSSKFVCVS